MKTLKILFFVLLVAQMSKAQEIDLGAKLGANFSNINDVEGLAFENKTGFTGGAFFMLKFNNFGIQPELLYSQQGASLDIDNFDLDYINVPVIFKFYITGGLNLQAGPQFGFLVSDSDIPESIRGGLETQDFDFSGAGGIGLDLPLGFRADARYIIGLNDVFDNVESRQDVILLSIGYTFL